MAWSWLRSFDPASLDERTFKLVARAGDKHMLAFATEPRRKDLQAMIASILGRPVKLELVAADTTAEPSDPNGAPGALPGALPGAGDQRREAMRLPLVREVVDLFEASLIDVKPEPKDDSTIEPMEGEQPDV
jgi:hypothetical protein